MLFRSDIGIARKEGIIEGHASGLVEGYTSGIEEGQTKEKLAIISKLLSKGHTKEQISEMLDMSLEEIEEIVN